MKPTIHPTAIVGEGVTLGEGTTVGPYAIIEDGVVIGRDNQIGPHAFLGRGLTLGDANQIHPHAVIGHVPQDLGFDPATETFTRIGNRNVFREHCQVHRATQAGEATILGDENLMMACSHVAHDCVIGNNVVLVNQASIPGHCEVGDRVIMSGFTGIHQFCRIGRLAMVSALSVSNKDLPPFFIYGGRPALGEAVNRVGLRRAGISRESQKEIKEAYRLLYRSGLSIREAVDQIEATLTSAEAQEIVTFVRTSKRGIAPGSLEVGDTLSTKPHRAKARGARDVREDTPEVDSPD